jgi:hypothetical protein
VGEGKKGRLKTRTEVVRRVRVVAECHWQWASGESTGARKGDLEGASQRSTMRYRARTASTAHGWRDVARFVVGKRQPSVRAPRDDSEARHDLELFLFPINSHLNTQQHPLHSLLRLANTQRLVRSAH